MNICNFIVDSFDAELIIFLILNSDAWSIFGKLVVFLTSESY